MMVVFLDLADSSSVDGDGELFEMRLVGEESEYVEFVGFGERTFCST